MNLILLPIKTKLASKAEPELGTAQPQIVCLFIGFAPVLLVKDTGKG